MPKFDRTRTLEQLESELWPHNDFGSHVVQESQRLRKIPLEQLTVENLRLLIGQAIGLSFLVPIALEHLESNLLAHGDFYPGDLLASLRAVPKDFWSEHTSLNNAMVELGSDVFGVHKTLSELLPFLQRFQYK
jgi:hypothetical protein